MTSIFNSVDEGVDAQGHGGARESRERAELGLRPRLTAPEELEEDAPEEECLQEPAPSPLPEPAGAGDCPLNQTEYRLLQCLLYGRDYGWVQSEGYLLSVLVDSINEKLYDEFMDSVLDDSPAPVEDYIDDLKEMIHP